MQKEDKLIKRHSLLVPVKNPHEGVAQEQDEHDTIDWIPRSARPRRSVSASPPRTSKTVRRHSEAQHLVDQLYSDRLQNSSVFMETVELMTTVQSIPVTDATLSAAIIFSRHQIGRFDDWLETVIIGQVWQKERLTRIEAFAVESLARTILEDWLKALHMDTAECQDTVWTGLCEMMMSPQAGSVRQHGDMIACLAGLVFAVSRLFDIQDISFQMTIAACHRDDIFWFDPNAGRKGSLMDWYNKFFLPRMKGLVTRAGELKNRIPFPSYSPDLTVSLSPFVSLSLSPFKHHLSGWEAKSKTTTFYFMPWERM